MVGGARDRSSSLRVAHTVLCALLLAGCGAEVTLEDDDGGRGSTDDGGAADGDDAGSDDGAGANGAGDDGAGSGDGSSGTSAGPSGADAIAEAQAACTDYYYSCNGNGSLMGVGLWDCNNLVTLPECAPALAALYRCATQPGGSRYASCDPELESQCQNEHGFDFFSCMNPNFCGSNGPPECAYTGAECSCTEGCDHGHVARMDCVGSDGTADSETCDCWFDGALVGTCTNDVWDSECMVQGSCCETLMR